jgi:dTDP-4-dehydrorhamnose reductase
MTKVLVLGAQGMLGSMVASVLSQRPGLELTITTRGDRPDRLKDLNWRRFDARRDSLSRLLAGGGYEWIINAIAVIAPWIDERVSSSVMRAIDINARFPRRLADTAASRGQRVIQITTDGVYSGRNGPYDESAPHDALDFYGKTKSLGEPSADHVVSLRCSLVGPELGKPASLLGSLLASPAGATIRGFTGQRWNGVTTLHFARLCIAVVEGVQITRPQHVVPADSVTKAELLDMAVGAFGRADLHVQPEPGPLARDRRLSTLEPAINRGLWQAAGYAEPPSIAAMVHELAASMA